MARITSGQVIVELVSVVKELVENSLDAASDKIEVTLHDYGVTLVEVSDNGRGIEKEDFAALSLKHHTSKLSSFDDLTTVTTLGFRGEAMSSLCSVAHVKVETCTDTSFPRASQLEYDSMGKLTKEKIIVSGKKGTTVTVSDLFRGMPVRQKNLEKNRKREYSKVLTLLVGYFLAYSHVRFTVFHVRAGKKSVVFGTQGRSTVDTLVSVYGSNGAHGLVAVDLRAKNIEARVRLGMSSVPVSLNVRVHGHISDASFGMGRGALDRQFLCVNRRPVTHKRLGKVINEIYKTYNHTQLPVFVLDVEVDTHLVDVNVTPDKRTVMMHNEDVLVEVIREELIQFYEGRHNVVPKSELVVRMGRAKEEGGEEEGEEEQEKEKEAPQLEVTRVEGLRMEESQLEEAQLEEAQMEEAQMEEAQLQEAQLEEPHLEVTRIEVPEIEEREEFSDVSEEAPQDDTEEPQIEYLPEVSHLLAQIEGERQTSKPSNDKRPEREAASNDKRPEREAVSNEGTRIKLESQSQEKSRSGIAKIPLQTCSQAQPIAGGPELPQPRTEKRLGTPGLRRRLEIRIQPTKKKCTQATFSAHVGDISQTLTFRKANFNEMHVVGQFNLGFIVVMHGDRLFIVDQHALDEIYNYERLLRSLVLRAQPLVVPRTLELSPIDEMAVLDHIGQLKKNGFVVEEDDDAVPGRRVKLVAVPVLRNVVFDDLDLHELVLRLRQFGARSHSEISAASDICDISHDSPGNTPGATFNVRCSKVDTMIALRACRLSIMVGQALSQHQMSLVVRHLAHLDRPWNCPHGRPTMRHLADLEGTGFTEDYTV